MSNSDERKDKQRHGCVAAALPDTPTNKHEHEMRRDLSDQRVASLTLQRRVHRFRVQKRSHATHAGFVERPPLKASRHHHIIYRCMHSSPHPPPLLILLLRLLSLEARCQARHLGLPEPTARLHSARRGKRRAPRPRRRPRPPPRRRGRVGAGSRRAWRRARLRPRRRPRRRHRLKPMPRRPRRRARTSGRWRDRSTRRRLNRQGHPAPTARPPRRDSLLHVHACGPDLLDEQGWAGRERLIIWCASLAHLRSSTKRLAHGRHPRPCA